MEIVQLLNRFADEKASINYLIGKQILYPPFCIKCGYFMTPTLSDPSYYRCHNSIFGVRCNYKESIFKYTAFYKKRISMFEVFYILNGWRSDVMNIIIASDLHLSASTVSLWYSKYDEMAVEEMYEYKNQRIGGPGVVVELDECLLTRHKYNRGRVLRNQVWILAGVERGDNDHAFIEIVRNRSRNTLLEVIRRRVRGGSIIMTDKWKGYLHLEILLFCYEFSHHVVNHSENFVDPITGAHTQSIESYFSVLKRTLRKKGINRGNITLILNKFYVARYLLMNRGGFEFYFDLLRNNTMFY